MYSTQHHRYPKMTMNGSRRRSPVTYDLCMCCHMTLLRRLNSRVVSHPSSQRCTKYNASPLHTHHPQSVGVNTRSGTSGWRTLLRREALRGSCHAFWSGWETTWRSAHTAHTAWPAGSTETSWSTRTTRTTRSTWTAETSWSTHSAHPWPARPAWTGITAHRRSSHRRARGSRTAHRRVRIRRERGHGSAGWWERGHLAGSTVWREGWSERRGTVVRKVAGRGERGGHV